jgi:MarR family transcriptional regulator, transcriptional regulator for hemolysin
MSEVADRVDSGVVSSGDVARSDAERGDEDFGWVLGVLLRTYRDRITEAIGDFTLGPRGYQTLREVAREQQPSQLALASHLGIDRTVMTYVIDELEEAGLVERRPNPDDRRQRRIVATPRGREAVSALCQRVTEAENAVLAALDPAERAVVRRLLYKAALGPGMAEVTDPCEVAELDS